MARQIQLESKWFGMVLLVLGPAVLVADESPGREPSEVVLKSLETKLQVDGRLIDTKGEFFRYRVDHVKDDWLWLINNQGTRGWVHRRDVVPSDQAIAYFSEAVARDPRSVLAIRMRGLAHFDADEYRRAIRDASAAIRLDPTFAPAYVDRASSKIEKHDLKGARDDVQEAIRLDPKSARAYLCRGYVLQKSQQYKQAIADFDEAVRRDPTNAESYI
jgi:tetratricopeptide (TPR) repeat protein